jgi:hypothetical protein
VLALSGIDTAFLVGCMFWAAFITIALHWASNRKR